MELFNSFLSIAMFLGIVFVEAEEEDVGRASGSS
jgi:hypothetical protein